MTLVKLKKNNNEFPCASLSLDNRNGLIAYGGDLSTQRLINAYKNGIFPWFEEGSEILWFCPNPRCILYVDDFHISRSLKKYIKKTSFTITFNQNFKSVIQNCRKLREKSGTWITKEMQKSYTKLFQQGNAFSVEVSQDKTLVGGLYGVLINKLVCGESMFSLVPNASKIALFALCQKLKSQNISFMDYQIENNYLLSLGAKNIAREIFLKKIKKLI